ncbi:hypothetical protein [Saccharothrix deserti]|uniref:hypothetical protein n=1 Tax=Saccharothrix deserti TaxID=2593674 RepID=UPI00131C0404|nr:hypothetical protein [Saccharothrix deserti]
MRLSAGTRLTELVQQAAPRTPALPGVGAVHAAQMLTTAGQSSPRERGWPEAGDWVGLAELVFPARAGVAPRLRGGARGR